MLSSEIPLELLVDVETADGLVLPGARILHGRDDGDTVVIWLHGFGSSYDYLPCLSVGRKLATAGLDFLSISVRGYQGAVTAWQRRGDRLGTKKVGSWYEIFAESVMDITAWLEYARGRGYRRLVLVGHSFGAIKVAYAIGTTDINIDGLVLASPSFGISSLDPGTVALAQAMTAEGDGSLLLPEGSWPNGFGTKTVSAQTYASWVDASAVVFDRSAEWQSRVTVPVLAFYGDAQDVGAEAELERMTGGMSSAPEIRKIILSGVTHNYDAGPETIAQAIHDWWQEQRINQIHKEANGGSL